MQPVIQALGLADSSSVENLPGGGGLIGLAKFVSAERGNRDVLMVSGTTMMYAVATSESLSSLQDLTPIARLLAEHQIVFVRAQSSIRSLSELIERFRASPESVSWAGGSANGPEQMVAWQIAESVGVEPNRVQFVPAAGGGDVVPLVLSGQVTAGINPTASTLPYVNSGMVRALGISSDARVPSFSVPTLREQGVGVVFEPWRGVWAPPGTSPADARRLESLVQAMARSGDWRLMLASRGWTDRLLMGPEFARFVAEDQARVRDMLRRVGKGAPTRRSTVGPYPTFVLSALAGLALLHARVLRTSGGRAVERPGAGWPAVRLVGVAMLLSVSGVERVGFVVSASVLFWTTARAFDATHPYRDAAWAASLAAAAYILFGRLLKLPLPAGVLAGLL